MVIIEFLKSLLYGIVEGITEWLPVSSTGHLILLEELLPLNLAPSLGQTFADEYFSMFEVVIQLGAILAVVITFFGKLNSFTCWGAGIRSPLPSRGGLPSFSCSVGRVRATALLLEDPHPEAWKVWPFQECLSFPSLTEFAGLPVSEGMVRTENS